MCLVNRRGLGKEKHVDMSGRFASKKVDTSVNPAEVFLLMCVASFCGVATSERTLAGDLRGRTRQP